LALKQQLDVQLGHKHVDYLRHRLNIATEPDEKTKLEKRIIAAKDKLQYLESADYFTSLQGTIGADCLRDY
jgi:hypothetical protein